MPDPTSAFTGSIPVVYDEHLVPVVFRPYAAVLAARVATWSPDRVLEVAAGTGALTRELAERLPAADIAATDLAPPMVERGAASTGSARVRWQQADAQDLPVADASVDVWVCQFGIMFVPDRARAYREAHRVLRPGGHLLLSTWGPLAGNGFAQVLDEALTAWRPADPPTFVRDVPHGYADPDRVRADLTAAGFSDVQVDVVDLESRGVSAHAVATAFLMGTPAGDPARREGPTALAEVVAAVAGALEQRYGSGELAAPMRALLAQGARPHA